jgi:hypothetical protein
MSAERGRVRSRLPRAVHFPFFMAAVAQAKSFAEKKAAFCAFINAVVVARRRDDDIVVLSWGSNLNPTTFPGLIDLSKMFFLKDALFTTEDSQLTGVITQTLSARNIQSLPSRQGVFHFALNGDKIEKFLGRNATGPYAATLQWDQAELEASITQVPPWVFDVNFASASTRIAKLLEKLPSIDWLPAPLSSSALPKQVTPSHDNDENRTLVLEPPTKMRRVLDIKPEQSTATTITTVSSAITSNPQMMKLVEGVGFFISRTNEGKELLARSQNGLMSPISTSALRAMRGAPAIAAVRTAMERAEAAGRSKAESSAESSTN